MTERHEGMPPINMFAALGSQETAEKGDPWIVRHKLGLGAAAATGITAWSVAAQPFAETIQQLESAGVWAGVGVVAGETGFIGGAACMLAAAGQRIGNPLRLRERLQDLPGRLANDPRFKAGFFVNAVGSVLTSGTIAAGVAIEMPSAWPMAALAAADVAATVGTRRAVWGGLRDKATAKGETRKLITRAATLDDVDRIADHDLRMFGGAYGENLPTKEESATMMRQRLGNIAMGGGWALVQEFATKEGEEPSPIVGFMTAFRTNKSPEEFTTWEESTNDGTLNGCVDPKGENVYICNLGGDPGSCREQMEGRMFGNIIASDAKGVIYFESRIPGFQPWLRRRLEKSGDGVNISDLSEEQLTAYAQDYRDATRHDKKGRPVPYDPLLKMYVKAGARLGNALPNLFQDEQSLNYGVVCDMDIIAVNKPRFVRKAIGNALRFASRSKRLMKKVF
ncbi:MAG TPA: hypothetical protein VFI74_05450 [Candidatus Saccharimonadales bacterium]|nr:hypothetical protein [Candidatus Saccharimonadales bacterium]